MHQRSQASRYRRTHLVAVVTAPVAAATALVALEAAAATVVEVMVAPMAVIAVAETAQGRLRSETTFQIQKTKPPNLLGRNRQ